MKKIFIMLALVAGLVTSCDMDKEPYNALPDTEGITTPTDFVNARVSLYSGLRSCIGGNSFYNSEEIQCDGFDAVTGYSNTLGDMYRWTFTTESSYFSTVYSNYQVLIARANYIIDGYNKCDMSDKTVYTENAIANMQKALGDAYFLRAYSIFGLSQYFCADYEPETAGDENSGVSYRLDYSPSSNASTYPARQTLQQTFVQINSDLDEAAKYIRDEGEPSYAYFSKDAITALRARVALAMHDYSHAAQYASDLITAGKYTLAEDKEELEDLWRNDGGNETIMQMPVPTLDELPAQTGKLYQPYNEGSVPDYIPTQTLVDLYSAKDYRKSVYFNQLSLTTNTGASATVYGFNKYVDQSALYNRLQKNEYVRFTIEPKVFRIAEMYLIAAEAYTQNDDLINGAKYLNELEGKRIADYTYRTFPSKNALMNEIKDEREREMVGEGTRLFDLKRWHEGIKRGTPQNINICLLPGNSTTGLTVDADSPKLTWPIPKHETDANKNIKQNPGY